jgi:hypothetical protein
MTPGRAALAVLTLGHAGCAPDVGIDGWEASAWEEQGFVQLVPPVPLPSTTAERATVEVWAWLPEGAALGFDGDPADAWLRWPEGAIVDRVERHRDDPARVVDVRGMEIAAGGARMWRLFRPVSEDPAAPLAAVRFPSGDAEARDAAVEALAARLATSDLLAAASADRRARHLGSLREKSGCDGCHAPRRPDLAPGVLVRRGTDAHGLFTPRTLLTGSAPVERYGVDRVGADPWIDLACADGRPAISGGAPRCADGAAPIASRAVRAALGAGDPDTRAFCDGRRWLAAALPSPWPGPDPCAANPDADLTLNR